MVFFNRLFPNKRELVGIGFNFGAIDKDRFFIDEFFFNQLAAKLDKALADEFFDFRMNAKTIDRTIARFIALREPHHTDAVFEKRFDFSPRKDGLGIGAYN